MHPTTLPGRAVLSSSNPRPQARFPANPCHVVRPNLLPLPLLPRAYGRSPPSGPDPDTDPYWNEASASVEDDGILTEATRNPRHHHHASAQQQQPSEPAGPAMVGAMGGNGASRSESSPLTPDDALLAAAPGTQAARLRDLQTRAAARRDMHWAMYRAHSAKANLLATAVLLTTTAGGTSGLVSLLGGGGAPAVPAGMVPPGWTYSPQTQGAYGSGGYPYSSGNGNFSPGFSGGFSSSAPPLGSAVPPPTPPPPSTAALLTPVLGFASTIFSGFQSYSKPSTAASRHLTAFKRYQLLARHARDALAYGRAVTLGRVIQAVERKLDQYSDESPVIGLGDPVEGIPGNGGGESGGGGGGGGGEGHGQYPPPPGPWKAFWMALTELPE